MKKLIIGAVAALSFTACTQNGLNVDTSKPTELATELDSVSYLLGVNIAKDLEENAGLSAIDNKSFISGMQRVFEDKEIEISDQDAQMFMGLYFQKIKEAKSATEKEAGTAFLEENSKQEGVQVTASGLQYKVLQPGTGAIPTKADTVKVHYTGKLTDGSVFDSSLERGEPVEFPVTGVIPGWTEALTMMPVGSKWEVTIPSELGYGERGTGPIPANAVLVFEVELLDIVK